MGGTVQSKGVREQTSRARQLTLSASAIALSVGMAAGATAQMVSPDVDARANADAESAGVEEIVVTAQRRAQNLQDVPIAITAVTQESLQANRVTTVNDLTGLAPGLISRQNAGSLGSPSFTMRGVFATASSPSQDREISLYQDGVYIAGNRGSVFDLPDLERIEVLRGPQGTLFGRNATAGAISIVTRDPTGEFRARQEVSVGNYSQLRTRTSVDSPQFGAFSGYVTYVHDERNGDVRNTGAGTTFDRTNPFNNIGVTRSPKRLGDRNFENVFAAVKFAPGDNFSMVYKYDRSRGTNTPEARTSVVLNPNDVVGQLLIGVLAAQPAGGGRFGPVTQTPDNKRPKAYNNAWTQPGFSRAMGHNLTTTLELSDSVSVKNTSSYRSAKAYGPSTILGLSGLEFNAGAQQAYGRFVAISSLGAGFFALSPAAQAATVNTFAGLFTGNLGQYFAGYEGNSYGRNHQWSTETQVNYDSKALTVTAGALYFYSYAQDGGLPGFRPNFTFGPVPTLLPLGSLQVASSRTDSYAAYVQGELHLTPKIDIIAGGRVTKDKKRGKLITGGVLSGTRTDGTIVSGTGTAASPALATFPFQFKKTKPTYSIGVNYKPNDDTLLYAKYSTAFLSGGGIGVFNFAPETVRSEEIGVKSELFDRRLRLNLALWHAVYKNQQSAQSGSVVSDPTDPTGVRKLTALGVVVVGGNTIKAKGVELEAVARPVDGLTFGGSVGYTDKKNSRINPALRTAGRDFESGGIAKWVGQVYGQYETQPLFGEAIGYARLDANYQGKYRVVTDPNIQTLIPAFAPYEFLRARWILNSRVAVRHIKFGPVDAEVAGWVRNLTNNRDALYQLTFGTFNIDSSFQPARTYGIDLIINL